ncbi:hypothetical protein [Streptomyces fructofermentans]|uniref:Uncharacterized protein n=1 Tax=Streptomyces fructofermentans TaxID=152141 RepID=A0A918U2Y5_9ACTN|nr:hypothetical protein [Streptomyces fructofermentans]GGX84830.1 hypothetical protein GCM10010515_60310 [Streptomyces fructofermentans]
MLLKIGFTSNNGCDFPAAVERAWKSGIINLSTVSATDLRYGYFIYPVDFKVGGQEFLTAAQLPLVDIMYTLSLSVRDLGSNGSAEIDFTENSYVIRIKLQDSRVKFTPSHGAGAVAPECDLAEYVSEVQEFVTSGISHLVGGYPVFEDNRVIDEMKELAEM